MRTRRPPVLSPGRAAVAGLLAVAAALAVGHLVAGLATEPTASPFLAVGGSAIDLAPGPVVEFAKDRFGTADKAVLLAGMAVVLAALGLLAGLVSRYRTVAGMLLITVLGAVGLLAVGTRGDTGPLGLLAPVASLITGLTGFRWLWRRARQPAPGPAGDGGRRSLLIGSAAALAGAGVAAAAGQALAVRVDVEASRSALRGRVAGPPAPPVPAGADFVADGTPSFLTSNADFYRIDVSLTVPRLRAEDWSLRVTGLVDRQLELDYADVLARTLVVRPITMACVSNPVGGPLISTASFTGVLLRDVLAEAGIRPGATRVVGRSVDGFTVGTPLEALLDPGRDALLAIAMNGEPLPREHGFPARLVVPGLYGYVSATKWVTELEVTTDAAAPYWEQRGWAARGPVKTQSRIDVPASPADVAAGRVGFAGVAWAPHTGIDRVEVRLDEGEWTAAELATEVSVDTWRMWRASLDVGPGEHVVQVRATDRTGATQPPEVTDVFPSGATGWHSVRLRAG